MERVKSGWNVASIWEAIAAHKPNAIALICGSRRKTWGDFDRAANSTATWLLSLGLGHQDKVAQYLYNGPEYLESQFAAFKVGMVPVNTNYRYVEDELLYLWDNADVRAVVFHGSFSARIESIRPKLDDIAGWLWVDDGSGDCPTWATRYTDVVNQDVQESPDTEWPRSGDDLLLLYTGGTTGMPKGVMYRQDDWVQVFGRDLPESLVKEAGAGDADLEDADLNDAWGRAVEGTDSVVLPASPMMHGTGMGTAHMGLLAGGAVALLDSQSFDPILLLDTIERERVTMLVIVGDAFGKPIVRALDAHPGRWTLRSLEAITSSGVMWSQEAKEGIHRHAPHVMLMDGLASSEALGMGQSVSGGASATAPTAEFAMSPNAAVFSEADTPVEPGSGEIGRLAVRGHLPLGYYKDQEKSDATFRVIDGERYSFPGDFATVEKDGTIRLLGRGSVCITTGGEKVFPEEVEEVIKSQDGVADAVVVGVESERWGEEVTAMVELLPDASVSVASIREACAARLSPYKVPKVVHFVQTIGRAPNGKVNYKGLRKMAHDLAETTGN